MPISPIVGNSLTLSLTVFLATTCWIAIDRASAADERLLRTGETLAMARLVDWSPQGVLKFSTAASQTTSQTIRLPLSQVVRFGAASLARQAHGVLLVDGSLITARVLQIDSQGVELANDYFRTTIPAALVRAVIWRAPSLAGLRESFVAAALAAEGSDDVIVDVNGDQMRGTLVAGEEGLIQFGDTRPSSFSSATGSPSVQLQFRGTSRTISLDTVRGLIFSPALNPLMLPPSDAQSWLGLRDGTRLQAARITPPTSRQRSARGGNTNGSNGNLANASELDAENELRGIWRIELACGWELTSRIATLQFDDITLLAGNGLADDENAAANRAVWPMHLAKPLRQRYTPLVGPPETMNPAENSNATVAPATRWLQLDQQLYPRTIAMPATSQAVYRLPGGRGGILRTEIGVRPVIADEFPPESTAAQVLFRIQAVGSDGMVRQLWESEPLGEGEQAGLIEIEIPAGPAIILEVERAAGTFASPLGIWIDPLLRGP